MEFIMKRILITRLLPLLALFAATNINAGSDEDMRKALGEMLPGFPVESIRPSPIDGVSEVQLGSRIFYISNDGKYLLQGNLIDMKTRVDLSEERRKEIRAGSIDDLGEDKMIVFPAKSPKHEITVFTDIDCTYCRKLHSEIDQYNARGITVRYVMFPRSGINTPSYDKAVAVWCEEDHQEALTRAKAGEELTGSKDCDNPVKENMKLGETMGLRGTPAIVLANGEMLPGYVPADKLAVALDSKL
jgi:thiol:disulfide interchange protein DsbC